MHFNQIYFFFILFIYIYFIYFLPRACVRAICASQIHLVQINSGLTELKNNMQQSNAFSSDCIAIWLRNYLIAQPFKFLCKCSNRNYYGSPSFGEA